MRGEEEHGRAARATRRRHRRRGEVVGAAAGRLGRGRSLCQWWRRQFWARSASGEEPGEGIVLAPVEGTQGRTRFSRRWRGGIGAKRSDPSVLELPRLPFPRLARWAGGRRSSARARELGIRVLYEFNLHFSLKFIVFFSISIFYLYLVDYGWSL
jgi:hypothetical protein